MRTLKKAKPSGMGIMIRQFETVCFVPAIRVMNPSKNHKKSDKLVTIRTPALPLLPELWLLMPTHKIDMFNYSRPVLEVIKVGPSGKN